MEIRIIKDKITLEDIRRLTEQTLSDMVKVVVDIERGIMAIGGEMHSDCEQALLEDGSKQENLWGANVYPAATGEDFIEYKSLINIRPRSGNRFMIIEDAAIRDRVKQVITSLIQ